MTVSERRAAAAWFTGLVPDEVASAYEKLRAAGKVPKDQAEAFLGGAAVVKDLCDRGMAHVIPHTPTTPASFQAASVVLALQAVLADRQANVLKEQQLLLDGQHRLSEAQARSDGTVHDLPEHLVNIITDREEILRVSTHLINTARRDWMTLESAHTDMPLTGDNLITAPKVLRAQVRIRSIYDAATLHHPAAAANLQQCLDAGEEARILPEVPMRMQLADETSVLLPLTPTGTGGALLVSAAPITRTLRDHFETLWERATPFGSRRPPSDCPLTDIQQRVLGLMTQGFHDEQIATRMATSVTTIRRHITAIMKRLDATSRFAAGATAQRRGWLGTD
jgi:DNA-binding CsgD family transcriptional regulator